MTPYQVGWVEDLTGSRAASGRWAKLIAPIITAILVAALGVVVVALISSADSGDQPSLPPAAAEPAGW